MCGRVSTDGGFSVSFRSSKGGIEAFGGLVGITNRMVGCGVSIGDVQMRFLFC